MRVFFLGAYSEKGRAGLLDSSTAARVTAVTTMVEKAGAKLGSLTYLQGKYDVIADLEVDCVETAAGIREVMLLSGAWNEILVMPEFDLDKAVAAAKAVGAYAMPGEE